MKQTLFVIPASWFEGPLLYAWLVLGLFVFGFLFWKHQSTKEPLNFLPVYLIGAAVIYFLFPRLLIDGIDPKDPGGEFVKLGLAIRGYGLCMTVAMLSAVGLIYFRCRQLDFDFDRILSLVFWMIVVGIAGARLFYIIQKWDEFSADSTSDLLVKLVDMTKGGLVVYGSLIGGVLAAATYFWITKLPWRKTIDIIAPAMVLGLAIGRIGCLMNGCCYGGVCESQFGVGFPAGSPPYVHQLFEGRLLGIESEFDETQEFPIEVTSVEPAGWAAKQEIKVGDRLYVRYPDPEYFRAVHEKGLDGVNRNAYVMKEGSARGEIPISISELPAKSLRVHPTQIYSAVNAFLLTGLLWFYFPFRKFNGEVFALLIILYPIARFLLETIRVDEGGQLNTELTISQIISIGLVLLGFAFWTWCRIYSEGEEPPGEPPAKDRLAGSMA